MKFLRMDLIGQVLLRSFIPQLVLKKAGASFVEKLNDGRLIAFQIDEYSANTGDEYSFMMTMISADNGKDNNSPAILC